VLLHRYGVGISDCIHTARGLLEGGAERVILIYCVRYAREAVLRDEIEALQQLYSESGRFAVHYYFSREPQRPVGIDAAVIGRLQLGGLKAVFADWREVAWECAFLVVGTREMCRQTYAMLSDLGLGPRRLCGFSGTEAKAPESNANGDPRGSHEAALL
jgi:ferredoxin-NADP reductase